MSDRVQYLHFKKGVSLYDVLYIHPVLLKMLTSVQMFCLAEGCKPMLTSIYRPPNDGISKSTTHQTYRAFDLSLKSKYGWNNYKIEALKKLIEEEYKDVGAISSASGESRPIYIHPNSNDPNKGYHAHFQIRKL